LQRAGRKEERIIGHNTTSWSLLNTYASTLEGRRLFLANILITGGLGFLGSQLARSLSIESSGEREITLFDITRDSKHVQDIIAKDKSRIKIVRGDLTVLSDVLDAVKGNGIDCIFHLASTISAASDIRPVASYKVNFEGTVNVLEAARLFGVRKVIYSSSVAVYSTESSSPIKASEEYSKWPTTSYGISKAFSEQWGRFYESKYGIKFRSLRFPVLVGPGREWSTFGFSSFIIQKSALGEPFQIPLEPEFRTSVAYVKDAARALVQIYKANSLNHEVYNVPSIRPSAQEVVNEVKKHLPNAALQFAVDQEFAQVAEKRNPPEGDSSRLKEDLNFELRFNLERMVVDFLEEIRTNKHLYV